ncbi:hypothetical protein EZV61_18455 [Corallincola luteus]|uniref:Uncharacterized protein n=1 Tax=Corallincola luteus TaxID=1775177 RepID=A0ABY2AIA6_9GAMM|nr:PQQ-binding-like beta-propeller repeat protein [Corallincola luteus]TCI01368.1 hypothetical protein EZV61_18455 [Corallincola luteus]
MKLTYGDLCVENPLTDYTGKELLDISSGNTFRAHGLIFSLSSFSGFYNVDLVKSDNLGKNVLVDSKSFSLINSCEKDLAPLIDVLAIISKHAKKTGNTFSSLKVIRFESYVLYVEYYSRFRRRIIKMCNESLKEKFIEVYGALYFFRSEILTVRKGLVACYSYDMELLWERKFSFSSDIEDYRCVDCDNGILFVFSINDRTSDIFFLNSTSGDEFWHTSLDFDFGFNPTLDCLMVDKGVLIHAVDDRFITVDLKDGQVTSLVSNSNISRFQPPTYSRGINHLQVCGDYIIAADLRDAKIYCLNKYTNELIYSYSMPSDILLVGTTRSFVCDGIAFFPVVYMKDDVTFGYRCLLAISPNDGDVELQFEEKPELFLEEINVDEKIDLKIELNVGSIDELVRFGEAEALYYLRKYGYQRLGENKTSNPLFSGTLELIIRSATLDELEVSKVIRLLERSIKLKSDDDIFAGDAKSPVMVTCRFEKIEV